MGVSQLRELRVLNLPNNSIGYIEGLRDVPHLTWLNLSGNNIKGKGRSYRPGQHVQLVQYLATVCPLTASPALETAEDAKLEKILSKQRFHQRQLLEETHGGCPSPPRPTRLDVESHSPSHGAPQSGAPEVKEIPTPVPTAALSVQEKEPVVQFNTWVSCDAPHASLPVVRSPKITGERIYLEDVQTDEDKINSSLLSSESTFLPFTSDLEPQIAHTDSEDETETFEPDSLAPKRPSQSRNPNPNETESSPTDKHQRKTREENIASVAATTAASPARVTMPQNDSETPFDFAVAQQDPPAPTFSPGLADAAPPVASSTTNPPIITDVSFPDSGFQSTSDQQAAQEDSFLSSGTADSLKTVRALSPVRSGFAGVSDGVDSADCSLLEEYLSSVQQREEEADEVNSDKTETPQPSPSRTASTIDSPTQKAAQATPFSV
ncbi:hypothetical protein GOODEAATRI_020950 [Goodea atripinnis]|uniref:Uncharacterized protein n=1 Tax=Goodea atripinnis TaxID=208336 RepID=A0ABV0PFS4_9TELE